MKILTHIAAVLLFAVFQMAAWTYFLGLGDQPAPPEGSPPALFMGALVPTGYFAFVKTLEIVGSLLTLIPKTRSLGLLLLGPIVVNILCFHGFLMGGAGIFPMAFLVASLSAFLLWTEREKWRHLLPIPNRS